MNTSYEAALRLFNLGEFDEIRRSTDLGDASLRRLTVAHQLVLAQALALMGDVQFAVHVLRFVDTGACSAVSRAQYHLTLGLTDERTGASAEALAHFQTALRFAIAAGDELQIAWSRVRILRHMIDRGAVDASTVVLRDARSAAIRAGDARVTIFLHESVAVLEGQLGRFDEARRHCDIAESLLNSSPNAWLRGSNLVNRGCLAALNGEFDTATKYLLDARADIVRSGVRSGAAEGTLAHCYVVTGQFKKAAEILDRVVRSDKTPRVLLLGALEETARLRLAQRDFAGCQKALAIIEEHVESNPAIANSFHTRWAAVTKGRLLLSLGESHRALELVRESERQSEFVVDTPLQAALNIIAAQASSRCGDYPEAAWRLVEAHRRGVTSIRELHAAFYFGCASSAKQDSSPVAIQMRRRGLALCKSRKVVSTPLEIDGTPAEPFVETSGSPASAVEAVAAALDLAYMPGLLGAELKGLLEAADCGKGVQVVESKSISGAGTLPSDRRFQIRLTSKGTETLWLSVPVPEDPEKAVVLAAISRIADAAVTLQTCRDEERKRAALWPADQVEMTGGALFLAEEMQTLLETARRVSATNVPVLITGETGTGKEVLARAIHAYSNRSKSAFLPFNCTSTPRDMLDSQLFGHRRGSFTGAIENFQGIIRGATGGTLFLDEIGDMSLDVQPKLLRFLESGEVHPVGATQPVKADVRVIAATNANLDVLVSEGRFREDLFYRLNIVHLPIPPLRERRIEIPALAHHYLEKYSAEYAKGNLRLAEETMEYLVLYGWPGNVRQLANEMRRMAALCEAGAVVMPEHLTSAIAASRRTIPASERTLDPTEVVVRLDQPLAAATEHVERALIQHALKECGGRMEETAARLGLSRKGLYLKRQRFGIEPPEGAIVSV
jgi:DNA-binding NtrC family response regulator/tetratricopeptide (TPR) repeat protein